MDDAASGVQIGYISANGFRSPYNFIGHKVYSSILAIVNFICQRG